MNEGARLENEAMYRRSVHNANESQNKKLDRIIELLEQLVSAQHSVQPDCEHVWVSADNEVVSGGEICSKCLIVRSR